MTWIPLKGWYWNCIAAANVLRAGEITRCLIMRTLPSSWTNANNTEVDITSTLIPRCLSTMFCHSQKVLRRGWNHDLRFFRLPKWWSKQTHSVSNLSYLGYWAIASEIWLRSYLTFIYCPRLFSCLDSHDSLSR